MKFEVGDRIVVREYDDMVNEYGVEPDGYIRRGLGYTFNPAMKAYCGLTGTIRGFTDDGIGILIQFDGKRPDSRRWSFCKEMLDYEGTPYDIDFEPEDIDFSSIITDNKLIIGG